MITRPLAVLTDLLGGQNIRGYPTLVLFADGKELERYQGGRTIEALTEFVQRHSAAKIQAVSFLLQICSPSFRSYSCNYF